MTLYFDDLAMGTEFRSLGRTIREADIPTIFVLRLGVADQRIAGFSNGIVGSRLRIAAPPLERAALN